MRTEEEMRASSARLYRLIEKEFGGPTGDRDAVWRRLAEGLTDGTILGDHLEMQEEGFGVMPCAETSNLQRHDVPLVQLTLRADSPKGLAVRLFNRDQAHKLGVMLIAAAQHGRTIREALHRQEYEAAVEGGPGYPFPSEDEEEAAVAGEPERGDSLQAQMEAAGVVSDVDVGEALDGGISVEAVLPPDWDATGQRTVRLTLGSETCTTTLLTRRMATTLADLLKAAVEETAGDGEPMQDSPRLVARLEGTVSVSAMDCKICGREHQPDLVQVVLYEIYANGQDCDAGVVCSSCLALTPEEVRAALMARASRLEKAAKSCRALASEGLALPSLEEFEKVRAGAEQRHREIVNANAVRDAAGNAGPREGGGDGGSSG